MSDSISPHTAASYATTIQLKKLIEANQALAQVESLKDLLPLLLRSAQDVTNSEASSILLYKPDAKTLEFALALNETSNTADKIIKENFELKLGQGIAGVVGLTKKPLMIENAQTDDRLFRKADEATGFVTRSIICVPIVYHEELLGVLQVLNSKSKSFFEQEDLDILESFSHLAAVAMIRSRMLVKMIEQERLQVQLDAASRIQMNFLPKIPILNFGSHIFAKTKPAIFVGGDFYDIIPLNDGSIIICVADVSGKGLPAALVGASLWSKLRSIISNTLSVSEILTKLNYEMYDILANQLFATMVLGKYVPETGVISLSLAGHLPPLLISKREIQHFCSLKGQPVGIDHHATFNEINVEIPKNSSLLLITDGITEARNAQKDFFGENNLELLIYNKEEPPFGESIISYIEKWRGSIEANDDLTVVEIWRN